MLSAADANPVAAITAPVMTPAETSPTFWRRLSRDEYFMASPYCQDSHGDRLYIETDARSCANTRINLGEPCERDFHQWRVSRASMERLDPKVSYGRGLYIGTLDSFRVVLEEE